MACSRAFSRRMPPSRPDTADTLRPGFAVLHGNRLELLAEAVFAWMAAHPPGPLDEECVLVPSNGMAEWFKARWAQSQGVAAALRIELPARFGWRAYRAVLGPTAVAPSSPLDKAPLTWRLLRLLPTLAGRAGFEPVAAFLNAAQADADEALRRRLQLASRLADLFDQYQVYRPDWLADWAAGHDRLRTAEGRVQPLPPGQGWQPVLWRTLLAELQAEAGAGPGTEALSRPALQQRFVEALEARLASSGPGPIPGLPRRLLLFGTTHLPAATLEALGALSRHLPVLLAVPNPSQGDWADTLLAEPRAAAGHPLLAAWGRQCRDFVRQLERFDEGQAAAERLGLARIELFDDSPPRSMLQQVQAEIRELVPAAEAKPTVPAADDQSLRFAVAHGALREVEALHDRLLEWLAPPSAGGLGIEPRDVVVMLPDVEGFAPAVAAVFGRFAPGHVRHVPWSLADRRDRGRQPLLRALEWLLGAPARRFGLGELRALLAVPALAGRLGLDEASAAQLGDWAEGAGVRWGLDAAQRATLGAAAAGEVATWQFGLDRLLMGYATGPLADPLAAGVEPLAGIEPYPEVAGLAAPLAGTLAEWLASLDAWRRDAAQPRSPAVWSARLRRLLDEHFEASDDAERTLLGRLRDALAAWAEACATARLDEALPLAPVAETWLAAVDDGGAQRFRGGGVTFCTLLPLRAVPFEVVCLLGMDEGAYPREAPRNDFDLMAEAGAARAGDRARRDDDRQLMLDALLSARQRLYVSWSGRSARDDSEQPPSILVAQLREHLVQRFGAEAVEARTDRHPLQPFSRRYFEQGAALVSHAGEWRALHGLQSSAPVPVEDIATASTAVPPLATLAALTAFLRNPVRAWFAERLAVRFEELALPPDDEESFAIGGLEHWQRVDALLAPLRRDPGAPIDEAALQRLARQGRLPLAGPGEACAEQLRATVGAMAAALATARMPASERPEPRPLHLQLGAESFDAGSVQLLPAADGGPPRVLRLTAGRLLAGGGRNKPPPRGDKLVEDWLLTLALAAAGLEARLLHIGEDAVIEAAPAAAEPARATLSALLALWRRALAADEPLPAALRSGLAEIGTGRPDGPPEEERLRAAARAYDGGPMQRGEGEEPCLARLFPDFATLAAQPGHAEAVVQLYAPLAAWLASDDLVVQRLADGAEDGDG